MVRTPHLRTFKIVSESDGLRIGGEPIHLGRRALQVLQVLMEAEGAAVEKDLIIRRVWPRAVVEENTLEVHISAIRKSIRAYGGSIILTDDHRYQLAIEGTGSPIENDHVSKDRSPTLIGREDHIRTIGQLFDDGRHICLIGPAGVGKSSLAAAVAHDIGRKFPDGVRLIDFADASHLDQLRVQIATELGLEPDIEAFETGDWAAVIASQLNQKKFLLIVDNVDLFVDEAARLVDAVLSKLSDAHILSTGRERLRSEAEFAYRTSPLGFAQPSETDTANTRQSDAARLFIERARGLENPEHPRSLAFIEQICRKVDGIPLAIELAATLLGRFDLQELSENSDLLMTSLQGAETTAGQRHASMRAAFEWTYHLLDPSERRVLQRLSEFESWFSIQSALAMIASECDETGLADVIAALVEKSLVLTDGALGRVRYRLLETTKAFASLR